MNSKDAEISWPSAVVACALIVMVSAIGITAIIRYSVTDALKVWTALGPVIGVITGAFVTYFFTRKAVAAEKEHAVVAEKRMAETRAALTRVAGHVPQDLWPNIIASDPAVAKALSVD